MSRSKRTRLTDSPQFERAYRQGIAHRGRLFSVHAFPNESGSPRLGLSVSKRVGNAVVRNALRRRFREVFRAAITEIPGDLDVVISARPSAADASFEELECEFRRSLKRFGRPGASRSRRA